MLHLIVDATIYTRAKREINLACINEHLQKLISKILYISANLLSLVNPNITRDIKLIIRTVGPNLILGISRLLYCEMCTY